MTLNDLQPPKTTDFLLFASYDTIRDAILTCNVQSKADMSQLNLAHGTNNKKVEKQKLKSRPGLVRLKKLDSRTTQRCCKAKRVYCGHE